MASRIIGLVKDGNMSGLEQYVGGLRQDQTPEILKKQASKNASELAILIQGIFQGSPVSEPSSLQRRLQVFIQVINLLQTTEVSNKVATEMVGFLMFETSNLSASGLAELANLFIDIVKNKEPTNGKAYELLPNILSGLATKETVVYGNNTMTGIEYKNHMLNTLCSCRWESHCVIHLAAVIEDIPLTPEQLQFFMVKIIRLLKNTDLQELPPVVYQLLALSVKGHRKLVLEGIMNHMNEQGKLCKQQQHSDKDGDNLVSITPETLRHVEGTIILHMRYSIMKDMDLGREFVKLLKTGQQSDPVKILTPFNIALALSVAHIRRFEEPIFDFLKMAVLKSFKDAERQKHSKWIAELVPEVGEVTGMILETVQNSSHGWDHVTEGMVQLGFTLMDAFGPKPGPFGKTVETGGQPSTPTQKSCDVGSQILSDTFKVHEMVRSEVLEQILNRVVTKTTAPVTHYLDLLSKVIASAPQILMDSLPKVKEAFELFLAHLPLASAEGLMKSVQPMMKLNVSLKDALMLVLRKAMFARQGDSRKIAVSGYLQVLKHFQVYGSLPASQQSSQSYSGCSQTQVDIHNGAQNPSNYEAIVCMEILANLRRCLTQEADVRLTLYQGLFDVLCRNSKLKDSILTMLNTQLKKYYETDDDVTPPVKLEPCIIAQGDQVFLAEPMAHLLQAVCQCVLRTRRILDENQDDEEEEDEEEEMTRHVLEELENMMTSLTRRMIKSEMEDFELDKSADFSLGNSVGVKNNIFAILVLGLYDVLIEYNFTDAKFSVASGEKLLQLFSNHHTLAEILRDKSGAGKKGKTGTKTPCSLLSIRFVTMVMRALFCDEVPDHQQCLAMMREQDNFVRHLMSVAVQKVHQINDTGHCDGPEGHSKDKLYKYCCTLARVFLQKYSTDVVNPEQGKKDKGKAVTSMCLEGLSTIINIICNRYPNKLASFLHAANPDVEENEDNTEATNSQETVHLHIKKFQRMVMDMLTTEEEDTSLKDAVYLCNIISTLIKHLDSQGALFAQVLSWVTRVCKEQNIEDNNLTKSLVTLLFSTSLQAKDNIILLREIARDIHSSLGDSDPDVEVEERRMYSIVNHKTAAPTVLLLLLGQADKALEETEWMMGRMRGALGNNTSSENTDAVGSTQAEDEEKAVCSRLGTLVNVFQEVIQTSIPAGACTDACLKTITRLYNTLTLLTKYYLLVYTQQTGHMSPRFEKLVKLFASNLTRHAYAMINYVQQAQSEKLSRMAAPSGKAGKKDKKKNDNGGAGDAGAGTSGKARIVMKESRSIPNLVYAIEQAERFLIRLTKKSKVDLMQHVKLSTSRDFRINSAVLQAALDEQEPSSDEGSSGEEVSGDEENQEPVESQAEPPAKKTKVNKLGSKKAKKLNAK